MIEFANSKYWIASYAHSRYSLLGTSILATLVNSFLSCVGIHIATQGGFSFLPSKSVPWMQENWTPQISVTEVAGRKTSTSSNVSARACTGTMMLGLPNLGANRERWGEGYSHWSIKISIVYQCHLVELFPIGHSCAKELSLYSPRTVLNSFANVDQHLLQ